MTSPDCPSSHLASYYSAFRADDTLITIIPSFDMPDPTSLISSAPIGPFQAGMPANVPLWTAVMLHQRSLCSISPPAWLTASNLSEIIAFEKKEARLWDEEERLPRDYYEIAKRLTGRKGISFTDSGDTTGSNSQSQVISLLVQDLFDVRVDKLRQQLPSLLLQHQDNGETDLIVNINGIGSQELALLRPFIQRALNDRAFLLAQSNIKEASGTNDAENDENRADGATSTGATTKRVPLRRFRR